VASELVKKPAKAKGIYSVTSQLFLNFHKRRNPEAIIWQKLWHISSFGEQPLW
jgi:hypothetical protein